MSDVGPMSEAYPHLVFHNFTSKLGHRAQAILKHLFPVPKDDSRRVITFVNNKDYISFRHHTYKLSEGRHIELKEAGPRFKFKLYKIILGTVECRRGSHCRCIMGSKALHEHHQKAPGALGPRGLSRSDCGAAVPTDES